MASVAGALVFGAAIAGLHRALQPNVSACSYPPAGEAAKLMWGASALALCVALILAVVASALVVLSDWRRLAGRDFLAAGLLAAGGGLCAWALLGDNSFSGGLHSHLETLLESCPPVTAVLGTTNIAALFAVLACTLAFHLLSQPLDQPTISTAAARIRSMRLVLYAAASLLLVAVLEVSALYTWADVVGEPKLSTSSYAAFACGTLFTALLALLYVPASSALREDLETAIQREGPGFDAEEWARRSALGSLSVGPGESLAVIAPFLSAIATVLAV